MKGRIDVNLDQLDLGRLKMRTNHVEGVLAAAMRDRVLKRSNELVPKAPDEARDGVMLAESGRVERHRGGFLTVAVQYHSVYAHWIEEHLWFKHPHGGQAKFLETALMEESGNVVSDIARNILDEHGVGPGGGDE